MRRLKPSYIFAASYLIAHAAVIAALALTVWRKLFLVAGTYNVVVMLGFVWLFSSNLWLAAARRPEGRRSGADALDEILDWLLLALSAVLFAELLDERAGDACFAVQRWSLTVVIIYLDWALCGSALYLRRRLYRT